MRTLAIQGRLLREKRTAVVPRARSTSCCLVGIYDWNRRMRERITPPNITSPEPNSSMELGSGVGNRLPVAMFPIKVFVVPKILDSCLLDLNLRPISNIPPADVNYGAKDPLVIT